MPSKLDGLKPVIDLVAGADPPPPRDPHPPGPAPRLRFAGSYQTVRRYVERARPARPEPIEERFETAPGHQAQVDCPHESPVRTPEGLELPLYAFHMVLGHSRDAYLALVGSMDLVAPSRLPPAGISPLRGRPR